MQSLCASVSIRAALVANLFMYTILISILTILPSLPFAISKSSYIHMINYSYTTSLYYIIIYNIIQASKPAGQAGSAKSGKKTFDGTYTRGKTVRLLYII